MCICSLELKNISDLLTGWRLRTCFTGALYSIFTFIQRVTYFCVDLLHYVGISLIFSCADSHRFWCRFIRISNGALFDSGICNDILNYFSDPTSSLPLSEGYIKLNNPCVYSTRTCIMQESSLRVECNFDYKNLCIKLSKGYSILRCRNQ